MKEEFLQYVWQYQLFDKKQLLCSDQEKITILSPGYRNDHAGPDFHQAKIKIGALTFVGDVEIHYYSGDWLQHGHQHNKAYDNVILHVVWKDNQTIRTTSGELIPAIELSGRIKKELIAKAETLVNNINEIPCSHHIEKVNEITRLNAVEKAVLYRLEERSEKIYSILEANQMDWEACAYQLLARYLGAKVNQDPFDMLTQRLPISVLKKHADNLLQTEALIFGQAGLLKGNAQDAYHAKLQTEYEFLAHKFSLNPSIAPEVWKFAKMRPTSFPTLRLAQLAAIIHHQPNLFNLFVNMDNLDICRRQLSIKPSNYWKEHYRFGKESSGKAKAPGDGYIDIILINAAIPLMVTYGKITDNAYFCEKGIQWLTQIKAEKNNITKKWDQLGFNLANAMDSQGLIHLYKSYCLQKRCLSCNIGAYILK